MRALTDLFTVPVIQAPMAGGASCPALAAEVSEAGGLGFLAAGYKTADAMREEIDRLRVLTSRPFGVNLFMPQPRTADRTAVGVYRERLTAESDFYGVPLGDADGAVDDAYEAKTAILTADPVPVVSFTFGCPDADVLEAFRRVGTYTVVTVTSVAEARAAQAAGADSVCVQGVEAGGHQGTHHDDPELDGTGAGVLTLIATVREETGLPVVAAGGIMRGNQVAAVLAAGAERGAAGHRVPGLPGVRRERAAQAGDDRPRLHPHRADPRLLRPPGPRPGQPVHARARPVRAGRLPAGALPDLRRCARPPRPRATRRAWRCGPGRATGWPATCPPPNWSGC